MVWVDKYILKKDIGNVRFNWSIINLYSTWLLVILGRRIMKNKFKKPKIKRPKKAFSFSEILARIEWITNRKKSAN